MSNIELVSKWYRSEDRKQSDELCKILKSGDIVQIKNSYMWNRYAVCTQAGPQPRVVYHSGPLPIGSLPIEMKGNGSIDEAPLAELAKGDEVRINNARDKVTKPKLLEDIVQFTAESVGSDRDCWYSNTTFDYYDDGSHFAELARYPREELENRLDNGHRSQWMTEQDLPLFLWLLQEGDIVEFNRKNVYSHWAVCFRTLRLNENEGTLAHRSGSGDSVEVAKKMIGKIMLSRFGDVIKGCTFRINNSWDSQYKPRTAEDVCRFASSSIHCNAFGKYNLAFNNCWHFAMQARYGVKIRKNVRLSSEWFSSPEEFVYMLSVGDIIVLKKPCEDGKRREELAIYIGSARSAPGEKKAPEVAHLFPSGVAADEEKAVVCTSSVDEFFATVARGASFRISNQFDCIWEPKKPRNVVKYARRAIGKENPFFVVGARYGIKAQKVLEAQGLTVMPALNNAYADWCPSLLITDVNAN